VFGKVPLSAYEKQAVALLELPVRTYAIYLSAMKNTEILTFQGMGAGRIQAKELFMKFLDCADMSVM
jgi:hypothetical protein